MLIAVHVEANLLCKRIIVYRVGRVQEAAVRCFGR
jgi:hypothetical protein